MKGLTTRNAHVKYESSITSDSKIMANVKVFDEKRTHGTKILCPRSNDAKA